MLFENDTYKKIARLERDVNRRMQHLEQSFSLMRETLVRMKKENIELKQDRDFLLEKYNALLQKLPIDEIKETIIEPAKQSIAENAKFFEKVAKQGIVSKETMIQDLKRENKAPLDELFSLVVKGRKVKLSDAAKKLRTHEWKVEQWARVLEQHELIDVHYPENGEILLEKR